MSRRSVSSAKKQDDFATRFAEDFETDALADRIADDLGADDQLARLCDAAASASAAGELRASYHGEDADHVEDVKEAWGILSHVARQRALEVVAEACARTIDEGDEWVEAGHRDADSVREAKFEARTWLQYHTNEAARVGVLEVL
ncbi:hypothetical protein [Halorubrum tropicale]|uniref:Uncharacterized protein n=1 Tax=Halorubrum tropicale TaxID=1765655 RepID=A0A0N0BNE1_9EURY|nr:hypothetical protein [Halorubrum tropicale]KOX92146.1 hypothetical protein AMR74_17020 [Halorubrum tropicale]